MFSVPKYLMIDVCLSLEHSVTFTTILNNLKKYICFIETIYASRQF